MISRPLQGFGHVSGDCVVWLGAEAEEIFDRANGLNEILLDCWGYVEQR